MSVSVDFFLSCAIVTTAFLGGLYIFLNDLTVVVFFFSTAAFLHICDHFNLTMVPGVF